MSYLLVKITREKWKIMNVYMYNTEINILMVINKSVQISLYLLTGFHRYFFPPVAL